nr:ATP-binding cassette domain-containing protein [Archaeoglobus neptunius]
MLKAEEITVSLNGRKILKNASCWLEMGEILLVVGPNGSGKSTLLKAFMGLVSHEGRIYFDNRDITDLEPSERFRLGITLAPEKLRIARNLSVTENIEIAGSVEEAFDLFPELRPLANKKTKTLSGGERQMVVLARAFVSNPRYLLLDEPFHGLHKEIRRRVIDYINSFSARCGVIVVTHDEIEEIFSISDKTCILAGGEILYFGDSAGAEKIVRELFI